MKSPLICIVFLCGLMNPLTGQEIDQTYQSLRQRWNQNPITAGGMVGINTTYYRAAINQNQSIPFSYNLFAQLNLDVLGIQAPFSFFYSNANTQYRLPAYHFSGISPSYKNQTLHLGDRTMAFSPYTLSGMGYTGVGMENKVGQFTIHSMIGRLRKATIRDAFTLNALDNSYARHGWVVGAKYNNKGDEYGLHLFSAKDDPTSLPDSARLFNKPIAATIICAKIIKKIKVLDFNIEYAYNILTNNLYNELPYQSRNIFSSINTTNSSTGTYQAFNTGLQTRIKAVTVGLNYERIDPGYITPGALFFNNDLQTISAFTQFSFLKGKINSSFRLGRQNNNLHHDRSNDMDRLVASANVGLRISDKWMASAFYSSFSSNQKNYITIDPVVNLDTLILSNTNMNLGAMLIRKIGSKGGTLNGTFNYSNSVAYQQDTLIQGGNMRNYNASISYQTEIPINKIKLFTGYNYNKIQSEVFNSTMTGPALSLSSDFLKEKLNSSIMISYLMTKREAKSESFFRINLSNQLKLEKNLSVMINVMYSFLQSTHNNNEWMITSSFNYQLENKPLIKSFTKRNKSAHEE